MIETLLVMSVIVVLVSFLAPTVIRSYHRAKCWIVGCYAFHEWRIDAVDNDGMFMLLSTSKPAAWTYVSKTIKKDEN